MKKIELISSTISKVLNNLSFAVGIIFFIMAFISVMLQVTGRITGWFMIAWTEELSRYALIVVALFGSVVLVNKNGHLKVDFIQDILSGPMKTIIGIISNVIAIIFSVVMIKLSWDTAIFNLKRLTAALRISSSILYFAVWMGFILMLIQAILNIIMLLSPKQQPKQTQGGNESC